MEIRQSTAITVKMGPILDKTDAVTEKTAIAGLVVKVAKNGAAKVARSSATACTHDAEGDYFCPLDATDTNTLGLLRLTTRDPTVYLPVWKEYNVISQDFWDEKYGAVFALQAATGTTATLDAGASAVDDYYTDSFLSIKTGTGAGQTRRIIGYVGSTKVATVSSAWKTNPAAGSGFSLIGNSAGMLSPLERDAVANAIFDLANAIETGLTFRNSMRITAAALGGKVSGASAGAGTVVFRNAVADTKNRISASNDVFGNRTAVTLDFS